ncbi:MAG TPA: heavy metal-associated domain-containing protein [Geobacteraceae bacterium]
MKKGCLINLALVTAALILLGVFAFFVRIRPMADNVAVLKTAGLACAGRAATVERLLQTKRGVASTEVDAAAGRVIVGYDSKIIRPEELAATSSAAGYTSTVEETMSVRQYRTMTGKSPGESIAGKAGCDCLAGK